MSEAAASRTVPDPSEISQPFWDATRERRLVLQRCDACDSLVYRYRYIHGWGGCLRQRVRNTRVGEVAGQDVVTHAALMLLVDVDLGLRMLLAADRFAAAGMK